MANTALAVSLLALIAAAASLGYAGLTISGETSQLRNQAKIVDQNIAAIQKDVSDLRTSLQKSLEEARKQISERESLLQQITPFDSSLVAAALKEGALTIYSIGDQQDLVTVSQAFQKKFPGIKVNFFTAQNPELLARISAELKQPQSVWDVYESGVALRVAFEQGATQPYLSKQYTKENFPIIDQNNHMFFYGATIPVVLYNPKLVKNSDIEAVKTWEDVPKLAAKYPGKVLMHHPSRAGSFTYILGELKTFWNDDAKWARYLEELKALKARLLTSTGQIGRLVISEEGAIGIGGLLHDVIQARDRSAPLEFAPLSPIIAQPFGLAISKNAPHPNAAKLLVEFMMSPDGQEIFSRSYRSPMKIGFNAKSSLNILFPKIPADQVRGATNIELMVRPEEFTKKYMEPIFGPS